MKPARNEVNDGWDEDELFALVKRAYPYRNLSRETFDEVLAMLSEGIASQRGRYGAYLHHDRINRKLRARRGARWRRLRAAARFPTMLCSPWLPNRMAAWLEPSMKISRSRAWREMSCCSAILRGAFGGWKRKTSRMLVEDAHGAPPSVPFWRGEAPARTAELSQQLGELRKEISDRLPGVVPVEGWRNLASGRRGRELAARRMRARSLRRRATDSVHARRPRRAGRCADADDDHRREIF
jgi:ATP-dependent helicase Lhr and Lhr-like helicase